MIDIAILIPVHNRIEITKSGINNLKNSVDYYNASRIELNPKLTIKIIVIDDGSNDGTYEWIEEREKDIILLKGNGDLWWSGSINLGINYLQDKEFKYILLWNDDIRPILNYFLKIEELLNSYTVKGTIIASKVIWDDNSNKLFNFGCFFNSVSGKKLIVGQNEKDSEKYNKPLEIDWCGGMGVLISKEILNKVGRFDDTSFPQYHGDADYMLRAKRMNVKILVLPQLVVYNNPKTSGIGNSNIFKAFKALYDIRSNYNLKKDILFYRRHATSPKAYLALVQKYINFLGGAIKNTCEL